MELGGLSFPFFLFLVGKIVLYDVADGLGMAWCRFNCMHASEGVCLFSFYFFAGILMK